MLFLSNGRMIRQLTNALTHRPGNSLTDYPLYYTDKSTNKFACDLLFRVICIMPIQNKQNRNIDLKHLLIDGVKYIGLKYYSHQAVDAVVSTLPSVTWSDKYGMFYIPNTPQNLNKIFSIFKGLAWINCGHFYSNRVGNLGNEEMSVNSFRKRNIKPGYRTCPEEF